MKIELSPILNNAGLNLFAVFNIQDLPQAIQTSIQEVNDDSYQQLMIFGHGGKTMWQALQDSPFKSDKDPVDNFSLQAIQRYFEREHQGAHYQVIYPSEQDLIPLQKLGALAGWHHESPFRIGINQEFGSWFAYRVVVLANTNLELTQPITTASPCENCVDKPCIPACPAGALKRGKLSLQTCINYRLEEHSKCQATCLSRITCPIAQNNRYTKKQISYHYGVSLETILDLSCTRS